MNAFAQTDELRDLYRELILDHARSPRNFGPLENCTHEAEGINPLCGDKLRLYLQIDDGLIRAAQFEGTGCAISVASASLLTDVVAGFETQDALNLQRAVTTRLTGDESAAPDVDLGKLEAFEGVREFPTRVKCATLAWHALKSAIDGATAPVTTE